LIFFGVAANCGRPASSENRSPASKYSGSPAGHKGWLVIGPGGDEFGFRVGDTLSERRVKELPLGVQLTGRRFAEQPPNHPEVTPWDSRCSRYFGTGPFLLLVAGDCRRGLHASDNSYGVVLDSAGAVLNHGSETAYMIVKRVCPSGRDDTGAADPFPGASC
jgi:hypothetical protein